MGAIPVRGMKNRMLRFDVDASGVAWIEGERHTLIDVRNTALGGLADSMVTIAAFQLDGGNVELFRLDYVRDRGEPLSGWDIEAYHILTINIAGNWHDILDTLVDRY